MVVSLAEHEHVVAGTGVVLVDQRHILGRGQLRLPLEVDAVAVVLLVVLRLLGYVPNDRIIIL